MSKILVVDDEEHNRELLKDFLELKNYDVITAGGGKEALDKIREKPDLVLLDILMPDMSGFQVLDKIRETAPSLQVIMVTGLAEHDIASECIKKGAADYVTKPVDLNHLENVICVTMLQSPAEEDRASKGEGGIEGLIFADAPLKAVTGDIKNEHVKVHGSDRRRCRRFEIPGAEGKYKKAGLNIFTRGFSNACPVLNLSKGGAAFSCGEMLKKGQKIIFQLTAPDEAPLNLRSVIRRVEWNAFNSSGTVYIEFMPFGKSSGGNSIDGLNILRRFDREYGGC